MAKVLIKPFEQILASDVASVGGKNASLGEMVQHLSKAGVCVPGGFAITADGYWLHLDRNGIRGKLEGLFKGLDKQHLASLEEVGNAARTLISSAPLPKELEAEIKAWYAILEKTYGKNVAVAVRSSATAEDLPGVSFAGQHETFLNVQGVDELIKVCPYSFASLYTNRAISYRVDHGFSQTAIALSIAVQKMVRSDLASAGVAFTLDTESGHRDVVFINAAYGLGEVVVKGTVSPDEFFVHKPTLVRGFRPILKKRRGTKKQKLLCTATTGSPLAMTYLVEVPVKERELYALNDNEILELATLAIKIEDHYATVYGKRTPMDIEWAKDGNDGKIYIVQARPETVHSAKGAVTAIAMYHLKGTGAERLAVGRSVGNKIVSGPARVVKTPDQMAAVNSGDVVVAEITDPDWEPIMKRAAAIVTDRGGRTCHAAIVSRELGIPAIVGTGNGTSTIKDGEVITVDCSGGEVGVVYKGAVPFEHETVQITNLSKAPVKLMMNMGDPDLAFQAAMIPNDGVGLARIEFAILSAIKLHPMAVLHPEKIDEASKRKIEELTLGLADKKQFFVETLAQEIGTIVAAFYPKPVIVRFSDFKTNEYRRLVGGEFFEPQEENPMLGWRGASRYYHENYREGFALECEAMRMVRELMGLENMRLMLPFVRTVAEAQAVINLMEKQGLKQGENGLELYMMCEIPSNVVLIEQFATMFTGFSIGSNDLTQLTLGLDRDSAIVASIGDERNEAVKTMMMQAIQGAHKAGRKIGICGQAPSDYPEVTRFLVQQGVDSLSLSWDAVLRVWQQLVATGSGKR